MLSFSWITFWFLWNSQIVSCENVKHPEISWGHSDCCSNLPALSVWSLFQVVVCCFGFSWPPTSHLYALTPNPYRHTHTYRSTQKHTQTEAARVRLTRVTDPEQHQLFYIDGKSPRLLWHADVLLNNSQSKYPSACVQTHRNTYRSSASEAGTLDGSSEL